jgi:hypothetical protein
MNGQPLIIEPITNRTHQYTVCSVATVHSTIDSIHLGKKKYVGVRSLPKYDHFGSSSVCKQNSKTDRV